MKTKVKKMNKEKGRTKCEVWSRVVGYLRPVEQWNDGKQQEFNERETFDKQLEKQTPENTVKATA